MSLFYMPTLSIWEIAHRWHNYDPNLSTDDNIPLEAQDKIRLLTKAMERHDLRSCSEHGVENWIHDDVVEFKDYQSDIKDENERYREWQAHYDAGVRKHNAITENFREIYINRKYSKDILDNVYVFQPTLIEYCKEREIEPPQFWYDGADYESTYEKRLKVEYPDSIPTDLVEPKKVRPSEINKAVIQAIARTLWKIYPEMTIVDIIQHKATQLYGNGKLYGPKYLRTFISEVDPREAAAKTGRPRKKPSKET